jgi:hypothetical protein
VATSAERLSDFEARGEHNPAGLLQHPQHSWRYIAVHPFADDHELLRRIDWPAHKRTSVDAYWEYEGDIYFLQVESEDIGLRPRGLYYRWNGGNGYVANLVAVIDPAPIVRSCFEAIMTRLAKYLPLRGRQSKLTQLVNGA